MEYWCDFAFFKMQRAGFPRSKRNTAQVIDLVPGYNDRHLGATCLVMSWQVINYHTSRSLCVSIQSQNGMETSNILIWAHRIQTHLGNHLETAVAVDTTLLWNAQGQLVFRES